MTKRKAIPKAALARLAAQRRGKPPRPVFRTFRVTLSVDIRLDERLLAAVLTDEWRGRFYPLSTPEQVAEHVALNVACGHRFDSLDGFADQPHERVEIRTVDHIETEEQP